MSAVLKTIGLENMLPLLGFCGDSCFYGDTFYKAVAHESLAIYADGSTAYWPKTYMDMYASRILRCNLPFMATLHK